MYHWCHGVAGSFTARWASDEQTAFSPDSPRCLVLQTACRLLTGLSTSGPQVAGRLCTATPDCHWRTSGGHLSCVPTSSAAIMHPLVTSRPTLPDCKMFVGFAYIGKWSNITGIWYQIFGKFRTYHMLPSLVAFINIILVICIYHIGDDSKHICVDLLRHV